MRYCVSHPGLGFRVPVIIHGPSFLTKDDFRDHTGLREGPLCPRFKVR